MWAKKILWHLSNVHSCNALILGSLTSSLWDLPRFIADSYHHFNSYTSRCWKHKRGIYQTLCPFHFIGKERRKGVDFFFIVVGWPGTCGLLGYDAAHGEKRSRLRGLRPARGAPARLRQRRGLVLFHSTCRRREQRTEHRSMAHEFGRWSSSSPRRTGRVPQ